jgi:putative transposase
MMPRAPRSFVAGGIYHVFNRGNRKEPIFITDADRLLFVELLRKVTSRYRWALHGYCLLRNHYHLVMEPSDPSVSVGMQRLGSEYAQWFNRNYGFVGHVFQGRFRAVAVESDGHLIHLSRYLALNPVRAGLSATPSLWPWSSYSELITRSSASLVSGKRVLSLFGTDTDRALAAFRGFVEDS